MSRPASRKSSGKKSGSAKTPKKMIFELTEENEKLTLELNTLKQLTQEQQDRLDLLTTKLMGAVDKKEFGINDNTDHRLVSIEMLMEMLNKLLVRKQIHDVSVESRVEELETRVTEMSMELAKLTKKNLAYEMGLEDVLKMDSVEQVRDKVYGLQLIAGQAFHSFSASDPSSDSLFLVKGVDQSPDSPAQKSLESARQLNLIPPPRKQPGETHIRNMHRDLRMYVMKEMSTLKSSGADWRMFASRVGMEDSEIQELLALKLQCPMGRVFAVWSESSSATVRLLHRHLMSPQLRYTLLGKRVADFYHVD
ncbi:hypothetical protein CAPTEDRAFT_195012 [Capitella teleta]|uniref:Death domain-containing protein n=1 Tax=Capitella teleta TaxID=283909 RepID=R7U390_CAPTE|nr:hypothetical protein CAPTEDRAFT_195012 [Capitella teleta]|eukprot:ELU00581.1 hypothetical protein CAPTEDRAFT_195012 [Capitella teleta]